MTDPLGFDTRTEYNGVNQITKTIDPLQQETRITYDAAQRPASVIDPRNNTIESYQYDNGDRVTAVTDALNKATNNQYDTAGRLIQSTDRKGQITTYAYDSLNRLITVNFPGVTRNISYDAAGRLSRIEESGSSISYAYDTVDRITSATTDSVAGRHVVGYEYDNLDRVVRRTVNGADPTVYAYDNASRLTNIGYRNQTTTYTWDGSNRLTNKTLPNGIQQELTYDNADRLLSLTYKKTDNSVIETISYTYDAKGQRLSKSISGTSQRETPFTATYDAANRMTAITLTASNQSYTLAYDDNGNLTTKTDIANAANTTTYSWDSRNRLTGITAPSLTASFKYDVLNRRVEKTVNGNTVNYIYDGAQAIAEITGGSVSAAILTGLNIDEVLARYAASGNRTYLTDALGSVIAQANDTQAIENYYAYTPYGETTALGPDGGNAAQYTARENDGTGLYYYRARYYDPVLKQFTSEDPIGLRGGINSYRYVGGNPVSFADPMGLRPLVDRYPDIGVAAGAARDDFRNTMNARRFEHTSTIFQNADGTYGYTDIVTDRLPDRVQPRPAPPGTEGVGDIHNHIPPGTYPLPGGGEITLTPQQQNQESKTDKQTHSKSCAWSFLILPSGQLVMIQPTCKRPPGAPNPYGPRQSGPGVPCP